jgi:acyl-CoA hydrolase
MTLALDRLDAAVTEIRRRRGDRRRVAAPLGLGKPHRLLNALYRATAADPHASLHLSTALSLTPPGVGSGLEKRFLAPFLARHFGADYEALDYVAAQRSDTLPANVRIEEFYLQSGSLLASAPAQRDYASLNYTHVARAVAERGVDVMVQKVARAPDGSGFSLSCNPDLTFDLVDECARQGRDKPLLVAEVDPHRPWLGGSAAVPADWFDIVIDLPGPAPKLFALPRGPVSDADYAIGLRASALVRDGGTLQIGIGSLSDALCHGLILRHTRNAEYRLLLEALEPGFADSPLVRRVGGLGPFEHGLYGASELVNDGFMRLRQAGVLVRTVLDDVDAMRRIESGRATAADRERLASEGRWLDGAFYLGSQDLYDWLRKMPAHELNGLGMTRVSHINELYGGNEALERLQRRHARFFNTCMMMTALGAAVSDALEDGQVVSGVGGQYNFVAMAHALHEGRSVLMLRSTRQAGAHRCSNVLWNYGHTTIPRHLRDIAITEYGAADLRVASDAECAEAMLALTDAAFQPCLLAKARRAGKLPVGYVAPVAHADNTPQVLAGRLRPYRQMGLLPDYPLGSDFTPVEQRLAKALGWLRTATAGRVGKARTLVAALAHGDDDGGDREAMARMGLEEPAGWRESLEAKFVALALARTDGKAR